MSGTQRKTVGLLSLGCSKNRVDSENLLGFLKEHGYLAVSDPRDAQVLIVNTCGFIEPAKEESIDAILEMASFKHNDPSKLLIVTGCLSQRYGEQLLTELPEVDAFLGVAEYPRILEAIEAARACKRPLYTQEGERFYKSARVLTTPPYSAYVKLSDGCDNRCTYCAIPLIRGGYRSRPFDDIVEECEKLAADGVTEITLIAQDTSRYGNDFPEGKLLLPDLLAAVHDIKGIHWLRVLYCYPDTVTETLLDTIAVLPKVCNYLDLPLQHMNGKLLKEMNRRGTPEDIRRLIDMCVARSILVRTTMIVGFPGETDEQFEELLGAVKEMKFARLGAFTFSPEEDTIAAAMQNQIDEEVKQRRLDQLMKLQQDISLEINEARIGEVCEVLVEGYEDGQYVGRSSLEAPEVDGSILFTSQKTLTPGEYVNVKLTGAEVYDLFGEAVE